MKRALLCTAIITAIITATGVVVTKMENNLYLYKRRQTDDTLATDTASSSATGKLFSGEVVRRFSVQVSETIKQDFLLGDLNIKCQKWGVLTTIHQVSEAVRRQVKLKGWCLVVVADHNSVTTEKYNTGWVKGQGNDQVVYLTTKEQESYKNSFVQGIPWNHFGRKNIGYLYAIQHGADVIWDFDDDNMLKFWINGAAPPGAPYLDSEVEHGMGEGDISCKIPDGHDYPTYNPYPILGAPSLPSWPRGIPLKDIKEPRSYNTTLEDATVKKDSIGVLQSLADLQPDVDAVYRLTMEIPFYFQRSNESKPILVPHGTLTPYNAQATLHFKQAFWGLYLPVTVEGRVSDIWRSYITQRLLWDCGLYLGFSARPLVVQDRNSHDFIQDMAAEQDLYLKSQQLVRFLGQWRSDASNLADRIHELWISLYERDYIEKEDVLLARYWLRNLQESGYKFPDIINKEYTVPTYEDKKEGKSAISVENSNLCEPPETLTLWTSDLHDGTCMDVTTILASQGHKVILGGHRQTLRHKHVLAVEGISMEKHTSLVIKSNYLQHSTNLTEAMIRSNFNFFRESKSIANTDAFICQFPASMCEMWMPFNKSIIFAPAHRYNLGRCTKAEWDRLNEHLHMLASSPEHTLAALSSYDKEYLEYYTGLKVIPLYSYSGYYTSIAPYHPTKHEVLVVSKMIFSISEVKTNKYQLVPLKDAYTHYELTDLASHPAIVYVPYSVMSYKLTEFYSMAIPLFMPSMKFFHDHGGLGRDRTSVTSPYCNNPMLDEEMKPHPGTVHVYSPNSDSDAESEYYWLQMSDFFSWPHITYFDNFTDLGSKLDEANLDAIHRNMLTEVERKREFVSQRWCEVTRRIKRGKRLPKDYDTAINRLFNVSRLQVY